MTIFTRNFLIFSGILALCAVVLGGVLVRGTEDIENQSSWVNHSYNIISFTQELSTLITMAVSSQRGYIITKEESFLAQYRDRKEKISEDLAHLSVLLQDNPAQMSRLDELRQKVTLFTEKLEVQAHMNGEEEIVGTPYALIPVDDVKQDILRMTTAIMEQEYQLLERRIDALESKKTNYLVVLLIGGVISIVLLVLLNGFLLRAQTKRGIAERDLGEVKERLALALKGSNDGIFDWDLETDNFYWSPEYKRMLGFEPDEIESSLASFNTIIHADDKDEFWARFKAYSEGNASEFAHIFRLKHKSGRWVWVNARGKAIFDKQGKATRFVGAHTDVTHIKEYEIQLKEEREKAEKANYAKTSFLAHMSHEIRTPLTAISGIAEIFDNQIDRMDERQAKLVKTLYSSTAALKDLITDILDFSKIESNELELEVKDFPLGHLFEEVVSIMSVKANEKHVSFIFDYEDIKREVFKGDVIRLRQVLMNLVNNALKFTENGSVTVKAQKELREGTAWLRVDVVDTGIGIAPEHIDIVFEEFKQGDSSVSRKYGGTGLGLPISRRLARLMGGEILVSSKVGEGSTFSLVIPYQSEGVLVEDEQEDIFNKKLSDKIRASLTDTHKILMVEDYEGNIVVLGYILDDLGCAYDVARTGKEALSLWQTHHYDVVLMDIQMPEMDGFTATREIRLLEESASLPRTPIIGMTAHALVGDKDKCIEAGMDAYLPKPIVETELKEQILKYLNKRQRAA